MSNIASLEPKAAVPRTPAERALSEAFAARAGDLPGGGWVARVRAEAMAWLEANGLPTRRVEAFKYTDLRERLREFHPPLAGTGANLPTIADIETALGPLAALDAARFVLVDGVLRPELGRTDGLGDTAEHMPLAPLLRKAPGWLEGKFIAGRLGAPNAMTALNTAFMGDGLMLKIKPGKRPERPVLLVSVRASAEPATTALRHVIAMEPGAELTLIEVAVALPGASPKGLTSVLTDITVADGARLAHIACALDPRAGHLASTIAAVGANAAYRAFQLTAGPTLARHDTDVALNGAGSTLDISGTMLARASAHIDTTLVVDHKVPGCESRELFKVVLDNRARGVFQGRIIVRPGADKTDGKQMARALLLSEDAEFDSKPELEIYADDVACGHGATAAALDEQLMFYCRSRGIPEGQARTLLIEAFIGEAVDKVEDGAVREALMGLARGWLAGGTETKTEAGGGR